MRLGMDIEQISRLKDKMEKTPQFAPKFFTERERDYCNGFSESAPHYAARFCAKEAFRKALNRPVDWLDVEVIHEPSGKPVIRLHRNALDMAGACSISVTLSHAGDYATAAVIIWSEGESLTPPNMVSPMEAAPRSQTVISIAQSCEKRTS